MSEAREKAMSMFEEEAKNPSSHVQTAEDLLEVLDKKSGEPGQRKVIVDAGTSKLFVGIQDQLVDGERLVTDRIRITDEKELERLTREMNLDADSTVILPISVTGTADKFELSTEDIGDRYKNHLDHLSDKYDLKVIPKILTGFANDRVEPAGYSRLDIEGSLFYHKEGGDFNYDAISNIIRVLADNMKLEGYASVSLLTPFETESGIMQTLYLTMTEIKMVAEKFADYSPVIICDKDDILLSINPLIAKTGSERVE